MPNPPIPQEVSDCEDTVRDLVKARAVIKSKVTILINKLTDLHSQSTLTPSLYIQVKKQIDKHLEDITKLDDSIKQEFIAVDYETYHVDRYSLEMDGQSNYVFDTFVKLDLFNTYEIKAQPPPVQQSNASNISNDRLAAALSKISEMQREPRTPKVECGVFSGSKEDKLTFKSFMLQFDNVMGNRTHVSDYNKMSYLVSRLKGLAFKHIQHLEITDENYAVCRKSLEDEFLDKEFIIDELFDKILHAKPSFEDDYVGVKSYISEIKAYLQDLKRYENDFTVPGPGYKLLSHIVFSAMPVSIKREIVHKVNSNYPTLDNIFDNISDIIKTLLKTRPARFNKKDSDSKNYKFEKNKKSGKDFNKEKS